MLAIDYRRAFGRWFLLAILLMTAVYAFGSMSLLIEGDENALSAFLFSELVVPARLISPLAAALPFAAAFCADWRNGLAVSVQIRSGRKRFLTSKILCTALSGGLTLMLSTLLFAGIMQLRLEHDYAAYEGLIRGGSFYDFAGDWSPINLMRYYVAMAVIQFLAGMFYASAALAFSAFKPDTSLSLCFSVVLYRLFQEAAGLLPVRFSPYDLQGGTPLLKTGEILLFSAIVFGALTALCAAVFSWRASRRMRDS